MDYYHSQAECDEAMRTYINSNSRYKNFFQHYFTAGDEDQFQSTRDQTNSTYFSNQTIEDFNFDNILNMDTDTEFFIDPEELFKKYGNTEFLWSREDNCDDITKMLRIYPAMNDGVTIISKNILKHKEACFSSMKEYINYTLKKYQPILSEKHYYQLPWIIIQYSIFDYFNSRNLNKYFDKNDVLLHVEDKKNTSIIRHYFSANSSRFLPVWLGGTQ